MRIFAASLLVAVLLFTFPERSSTAQEKAAPVKWEYAELSYRSTPGRGLGKDADGKEVPAKEGTTTLRWTTGAEDISLKGWDELAEKLKVQLKRDSSAASQRIQVLNALGAAGWELVDQQVTNPPPVTGTAFPNPGGGSFGGPTSRITTATLLFKRRAH